MRTPGNPLTRLDEEMSRILNSPWPYDEGLRWKMYKEALWRYLHFIRVKRKQHHRDGDDTRNTNEEEAEEGKEEEEKENTRKGETCNDDESQTLVATGSPHESISVERNVAAGEKESELMKKSVN